MAHLRRTASLAVAAATAALDLWSKAGGSFSLDPSNWPWKYGKGPASFDPSVSPTHLTVVENWVYVTTTWNRGAAWSIDIPGWLLLWGTALAVPALLAWIFLPRRPGAWDTIAKSLILGGAVGNLCDRWKWGHVRDWIDVRLWGWPYPTFNVADVALVAGIIMLLLGGLKKRPAEAA